MWSLHDNKDEILFHFDFYYWVSNSLDIHKKGNKEKLHGNQLKFGFSISVNLKELSTKVENKNSTLISRFILFESKYRKTIFKQEQLFPLSYFLPTLLSTQVAT